ncbi:MAG: response regulator transcription factor [Micrococcaceae bacterium]|nr:response regulator transcription factor [Micrococcaceae bacterium]
MGEKRLRVHAADSDVMSLLAVRHIFSQTCDLELESVTSNGTEAAETAILAKPDIVLMETNVTDVDSLTATKMICSEAPEVKVVFLSTVHDTVSISRAYAAGASSFLAKSSIVRELSSALRLVSLGHQIFSSSSDQQRLQIPGSAEGGPQEQIIARCGELTKRLLIAVAQGCTNQEIAATLHVSEGTVKGHIAKFNSQLNISNRVQLAVAVAQAGLLDTRDANSFVR